MLHKGRFDGWRGVALVAITYVYFLIFAQFGFLKRLQELGLEGTHLKAVMGAMAAGGILASLLAPFLPFLKSSGRRLQAALFGAGAAAALTLLRLNSASCIAVSFLIGISLGLLTVTLVANLPLWIGVKQPLLKVGLGTGIGYFLCNYPPLFTATPAAIAITAASAALLGILFANPVAITPSTHSNTAIRQRGAPAFALVLVWFTALVWFDSAAFFIIQNSPALKAGTWEGTGHLWRTGGIHLAAAIASAGLLRWRGLPATLSIAFASLAGACLLLLHPEHAGAAAFLYPAGVSLYSVALVAYPSFLMPGSADRERVRRAGWIYAVAGWIGSAMGIGMAQNLHRVPPAFIAAAATLFFLPWIWWAVQHFRREAIAIVAVVAISFGIQHLLSPKEASRKPVNRVTAVQAGRRVYISEGCINCHSQYVRPHSPDVQMWGPVGDLEAIRREKPPLIGNRRQGPDLSEVGSRRSPLWLRIHLMDPRAVSYESVMPNYSYLFKSGRGDALVAYLGSLKSPQSEQHLRGVMNNWQPSAASIAGADRLDGSKLFKEHCATCHEAGGEARTRWASSFTRLPPNLATDHLLYIPADEGSAQLRARIATIIKFGLPGTNMPGHEYLPDAQIEAIAKWVVAMRGKS